MKTHRCRTKKRRGEEGVRNCEERKSIYREGGEKK